MKVHSDTATQFRRFWGTGSIAGIKLPDFNDNYVFTSKKTEISDSEYKKKIISQAQQDFAAGRFQNESQRFNQLMKQFVSEVSPDRQGIITAGFKEVKARKINVRRSIDVLILLLEGKLDNWRTLIEH
ncbi:hypothetical protein [Aminipila luticellarii]|uniref:Uncharacterized protein n=1 Tax=Aminipila luticellarii TaxID=2507160 RepID=A0A410PXN4_9FIRM|nr:hypothetical protein [Aminipila luticellarii]QAT43635.1 hypothetical protein EQM06_10615 [Aminipila luticellarii]